MWHRSGTQGLPTKGPRFDSWHHTCQSSNLSWCFFLSLSLVIIHKLIFNICLLYWRCIFKWHVLDSRECLISLFLQNIIASHIYRVEVLSSYTISIEEKKSEQACDGEPLCRVHLQRVTKLGFQPSYSSPRFAVTKIKSMRGSEQNQQPSRKHNVFVLHQTL